MARDDFSKRVIETLRTRVASRCSNPSCRIPTSGPSETVEKSVIIGIASHICAAAIGGPRYDHDMTRDQRKSIENGIWLCSGCSIKIDRDVKKYTVELLRGWKNEAEETADNELGNRIPDKDEIIHTVSSALTGLPTKFIPNAIANVHKSSNASLEKLDPRFHVESEYSPLGTKIGLFAKEDVDVRMNIEPFSAKEYIEKYDRLMEHGEDLEMSSNGFSFEGSGIFENFPTKAKGGKLIISHQKRKAVQKLWLINRSTREQEYFEDTVGKIAFGDTSFSFTGAACDGIFSLKYRQGKHEKSGKIILSLNFDSWDNIDLLQLPYFEKVHSLFTKLRAGWLLQTALEIDGKRLMTSGELDVAKDSIVIDAQVVLRYIHNTCQITKYLNKRILFSIDFSYSSKEYQIIQDVVDRLEGKSVNKSSQKESVANFQILVDEEGKLLKQFTSISEPTKVEMTQRKPDQITIYGTEIQLPLIRASLDNIIPKIIYPSKELQVGDTVKVELYAAEGFEFREEYLMP